MMRKHFNADKNIIEKIKYEKRKKAKNPISKLLAKRYERKQQKILEIKREELKRTKKMLDECDIEFEKKLLVNLLKSRKLYLLFSEDINDEELINELFPIVDLLAYYETTELPKSLSSEEAFENIKQRLIKEGLWIEQ